MLLYSWCTVVLGPWSLYRIEAYWAWSCAHSFPGVLFLFFFPLVHPPFLIHLLCDTTLFCLIVFRRSENVSFSLPPDEFMSSFLPFWSFVCSFLDSRIVKYRCLTLPHFTFNSAAHQVTPFNRQNHAFELRMSISIKGSPHA